MWNINQAIRSFIVTSNEGGQNPNAHTYWLLTPTIPRELQQPSLVDQGRHLNRIEQEQPEQPRKIKNLQHAVVFSTTLNILQFGNCNHINSTRKIVDPRNHSINLGTYPLAVLHAHRNISNSFSNNHKKKGHKINISQGLGLSKV